jgi:hypothetical protein
MRRDQSACGRLSLDRAGLGRLLIGSAQEFEGYTPAASLISRLLPASRAKRGEGRRVASALRRPVAFEAEGMGAVDEAELL